MSGIAEHYVLCGPQIPFEVDRRFFLPKEEDRYVVVDVVLVCKTRGETCPAGYYILKSMLVGGQYPKGVGGSFSPLLHICVKKCLVRDLNELSVSPIVDIRVQYSNEATLSGYHKVSTTVGGLPGRLHTGLGARAKYLYVLRADAVVDTDRSQIDSMKRYMNRRLCDVRLVTYESGTLQSHGVNDSSLSQGEKEQDKNKLQQAGLKFGDRWQDTKLPPGYSFSNKPLKDGRSWGENGLVVELLLKFRKERRSMADIPFKATIFDRYPLSTDVNEHETDTFSEATKESSEEQKSKLPKRFMDFCYPRGVRLLHSKKGWAGVPGPRFFSWSMTDADLGTRYVTSLIFYEKLSKQKCTKSKENATKFLVDSLFKMFVKMEQEGILETSTAEDFKVAVRQHLFVPKILNVVSKHCFYRGFQEFLTQLFRVSLSQSNIPIEDYVVHFFNCVPVPRFRDPGGIRVTYDGTRRNQAVAVFETDALNEFGITDFDCKVLFKCLSVPNIIRVVSLLLLEQKIIVHSQHRCIITPLMHVFLALIFPLRWTGLYIPMCSTSLIEVVGAPVPYLIGLDSNEVLNLDLLSNDVYIIDLDNDKVVCTFFDEIAASEALPSPIVQLLTKRLNQMLEKANMAGTLDVQSRQDWSNSVYAFRLAVPPSLSSADIELEDFIPINEKVVRDVFVRFMALVLFSVPKYLKNCHFKDSNDYAAKKGGAEKDDSDQDTIFELDEYFKIDEFILGSGIHMINFLKFFAQTQTFARYVSQIYRYYRGSSSSDNIGKQNRRDLLEDYRILFFVNASELVQIQSPHDSKKKRKKEHVMFNEDNDDSVQDERDTLFNTIPSKMKVGATLQEFQKPTPPFSSEIKRTKPILSQGRYKRHIEGPKDSLLRKKCIEKRLPQFTRPFEYNEKFPLLNSEILIDAHGYYVNKMTYVPEGFVKHVCEIVSISSDDFADVEDEVLL